MARTLTEQERIHLDKRIAETEKRTGAQIVLAIIERSDVYAELPWKAFALGASLAGLLVFMLDLLRPGWTSGATVLFAVTATLATGVATTLLCVFMPRFARLFLPALRAETEVRQYAESLFLSRELFSTRKRTGLLLLVSLFEQQVVLLPDTGLRTCLNQDALQGIIARMTSALAAGQPARALEEGLKKLEDVLTATPDCKSTKNELSDEIIEEKGV